MTTSDISQNKVAELERLIDREIDFFEEISEGLIVVYCEDPFTYQEIDAISEVFYIEDHVDSNTLEIQTL